MTNEEALAAMLGKTMVAVSPVEKGAETLTLTATDGSEFRFYHSQDCCEHVSIEDVCGDLEDLVGSPITQAEEAVSERGAPEPEYPESWTWTFYKFATNKGSVTIRWLGESNGYYSEGVDVKYVWPARDRTKGADA